MYLKSCRLQGQVRGIEREEMRKRVLRIDYFFNLLMPAVLVLAGCAAPTVAPIATTERQHPVESAASVDETTPFPTVTSEPVLTPPAQNLAEAARQVHGDRLISLIYIPALSVYAYVTPVGWEMDITDADDTAWDSPDAMVGWAISSALPGDDGNIILYGHNNIYSAVFQDLYQLRQGEEITLTTNEREWRYRVAEVILMPEDEEDSGSMLVEYMKPTRAPRLTIISCYPPDNNSHRVIVIARPVEV